MGNYCNTNNCCSDGKEEIAEFNMDVRHKPAIFLEPVHLGQKVQPGQKPRNGWLLTNYKRGPKPK
jgi:hypothetical protein